ncbi:MAG TPA: DEAD/DEAH box helicase family protein [Steroidobacteraceae bacterium]|jgi:hypothetical protein
MTLTLQHAPEAFNWADAIGKSDNPFATAMARYGRAPIAFVREVLKAEPDPWQLEALRALARGHTRISIRSGHGTGKSAFAAWSVIWFMNTRAPFKCVCTAPTAPQLFDVLYAEILKWFKQLPAPWQALWDTSSDHIKLKADPESFVTARTSRPESPESLQGVHSTSVLLVCDEASGIPEPVFEAAAGSMSSAGAITILIGNPTRSSGMFWRTHMVERDRWFTLKVSGLDSPRVTRTFVEEHEQRYGLNSSAYRIRVLGEFPEADSDTFIGAELVDQAMLRDVPLDLTKQEVWGLDVARFGDDSSVLIKRRGYVVTEQPRVWSNFDTMMLAGAVKHEFDLMVNNRPSLIAIDAIGVGAGVADRLMEQGVPVLAINVGEAPATTGRYMRLRDELWGFTREWLESRVCRLPRHDRLRDDLVAPRYTYMSDGRIKIESKQEMRARGLPSTDFADALSLTLAQQTMMVSSQNDSGLYTSTPVRDRISGMEY